MDRPRPVPPYSYWDQRGKDRQLRCDSNPKTTHPSRRTVRLCECIENEVELVPCDADTRILDAELERHSFIVESQQTTAQRNTTFGERFRRCELDLS